MITLNANIVAGLGDRLGQYVDLITIALIAAAVVIVVIGTVSIVRRK